MSLATDRDLLQIDSDVFLDAVGAATVLMSGTDGSVVGTRLTSAGSDFDAAEIDANHVVVINGEPVEIVERLLVTQVKFTRPRSSSSKPLVGLPSGSSLPFEVVTFERLIAQVESQVLGALAIEDDQGGVSVPGAGAGVPSVESIVNVEALQQEIALRALHLAYRMAAAADPADDSLRERASLYQQRVVEQSHYTAALLDLDGDGEADVLRRLRVLNLRRT